MSLSRERGGKRNCADSPARSGINEKIILSEDLTAKELRAQASFYTTGDFVFTIEKYPTREPGGETPDGVVRLKVGDYEFTRGMREFVR